MMETIFWLSLVGALYSYLIYPLLMWAISCFSNKRQPTFVKDPQVTPGQPKLSLIITAYNEQQRIEQKIEQSLALIYPRDQLQIIIASDASDDRTEEIANGYQAQGVEVIRANERLGKEHAQKLAIDQASGEIVVFTDVGTQIEPQSLLALAEYFNDPEIGAVSSVDRMVSTDGTPMGEGLYVRYEMALRKHESQVSTLVGLSGSFFAVRRELCQTWNSQLPSDFNTALTCARKKMRAISADDVIGIYPDIQDPAKEYSRKRRTILRGISALAVSTDLLNFARFPLFAFQLWSHKLMRWAVPWFQGLLLLTNVVIAGEHWFYQLTLAAQLALLISALIGSVLQPKPNVIWLKIPTFFMQANIAAAHALIDYLRGTRAVTWTPSRR
ncbi:MAG: glycosyltransferase family 2 protein [Immundisolibacteraceae bacterium]|nr:glycosyltransferase family 2 protein [Immundisolibacteraceae bacterium]